MKVSEIKINPDNPRFIRDENYKKLLQSIKDFPEMAEARPVVINKDNVILGGNMRFRAMKEAGWTDIPVKVVDWPEEKQKEFVIKDNISGGEWDWDLVAEQYELEELDAWGLYVPIYEPPQENNKIDKAENKDFVTIVVVAFDDIQDQDSITEFYNLDSVDITEKMRAELTRARKAYVFRK